jgi:hypothetical protein
MAEVFRMMAGSGIYFFKDCCGAECVLNKKRTSSDEPVRECKLSFLMCSLATSLDRFKGFRGIGLFICSLPRLTPFGAMFDDPISKSAFEANVVTNLLGFDPFVLQNLFALGLKFPIKGGFLHQIITVVRAILGHRQLCC